MPLLCPLCPAERTQNLRMTISDYLKHLRLFHAHQPNFQICCGINGCQRTFKNFGTYKNHVSDRHRGEQLQDSASSTQGLDDESSDQELTHLQTLERSSSNEGREDLVAIAQRSSAFFLMGLKEEKRLTQTALQGVIDSVTLLSQNRLSLLHQEIARILEANGAAQSMESIAHLFHESGVFGRPFFGLETQYQQIKYYSEKFGLIEPTRITLGERRVWKGVGAKRKCVVKKDELIYVPLLQTLQSCFSNPTLADKISCERSYSGFLEDYSDGDVHSSHPLFSVEKKALQLFLYYDEVEVCNPLGSKRKIHKLGMFYFHLGNIHPKYRSKLSSIQLLGIVKSKHISEYGIDSILDPFVADVKKLEAGVCFKVQGKSELWFGTVAVCSADNLGSLLLGGFKESCTAERCCRHCLATRAMSKEKFQERCFILRDKATHERHCSEIIGDSSGAKSKEYGVNRNSVLNELRYFHVCDGSLLPDIMHDLLEGVLQYEVKFMLNTMIYTEQYFSLSYLNTRLEHIELGYMESKNRPTPLDETKVRAPTGLNLSQNASQMWLLARILPLLIGDRVPEDDERWLNFLTLMEIVDRLFCPRLTRSDASYLRSMIFEHHSDFVTLYPHLSVIPKFHFMIHMPRLIKKFGPLVRHWTMRFEAKHSYFKNLAQSMGNFINLPYSLAMRHQQLQCYKHSGSYIDTNDITVGPGTAVLNHGVQVEPPATSVFRAKWVCINGVEYRKDAGVIYKIEDDLPFVGQITCILVVDSTKVFLEIACFSSYYNSHYRVYILEPLNINETILVSNLCLTSTVHIRKASVLPSCIFVILPYHVNED